MAAISKRELALRRKIEECMLEAENLAKNVDHYYSRVQDALDLALDKIDRILNE